MRDHRTPLLFMIFLNLSLPCPSFAGSVLTLPDGSALRRTTGSGGSFNSLQCRAYANLKADSQRSSSNVQWSLRDLDRDVEVAGSGTESRSFGASTSKMFVAAALLDVMKGRPTAWQMDRLKAMITVSSNRAWRELQTEIGRQRRKQGLCSPNERDWTCGQQGVAAFTHRQGYKNTRGYSGSLHGVHGNELNAKDTSRFLADTYQGRYPGADILWSVMQGYRTGGHKGNKYIPSSVFVGGKTGTYSGPSEVNGVRRHVNARNNALFFKGQDGHQYGLTILSDDGRDETVALLAGGVVREYAGLAQPCPEMLRGPIPSGATITSLGAVR